MSTDTLLITAFVLVLLIGAGLGAFTFFRSPQSYIAFGTILIDKLKPVILAYILKRMDPKVEAEWRKCELRGGKWDHIKKRCSR